MKNFYFRSIVLLCFSLSSAYCSAQDIHFSQFFEAPLYRNPALAGVVKGDFRIQTVYRSQWNSITNAYKTTSLNAEYKLQVAGDDFLTIGSQFLQDRAGTTNLTTVQFLPVINYHKSLSSDKNMYLSLGFMGGYVRRSIDRTKMLTNSTYEGHGDGESEQLQPQYSYFDGSTGISFNTQLNENPENNLVLGVAYHHFTRPKSSFFNDQAIRIQPKLVFSADAKLALNELVTTTVHNDFVKQGTYSETISGLLVGYKVGPYTEEPDAILRAGAFYRWGDALIPVLQIDYRPFSFSVSYDVNLSRLATASYGKGGYELSITYAGYLQNESSSAGAVRCPHF